MLQRSLLVRISAQGQGSAFDSEEYQLLQRSEIPTYHFQKSLRRLPIPQLKNSCDRYLAAVEAVCSSEQLAEARATVKDLLDNDGPALQNHLISHDRANKHTSYISEPWFDMYLKSRVPVPINYNPFMMLAEDPRKEYNDQLVRATNMAISCARFKKALDAEVLAPEVFHMNPKKSNTPFFRRFCRMLPESVAWFGAVAFKAFPLDMSQYGNLFGGNRIPCLEKDRLHLCKRPRHFLVVRQGIFYAVDAFDEQYNLRPPQEIHACLANILQSGERAADADCLGSLTTLDRDSWARTRQDILASSATNLQNLGKVDDALFLICLDDSRTTDPGQLANELLCGADGRNRFFDKCFQLIVDGNGQVTVNFEHSWGDGVAVLRLVEEVFADTQKMDWLKPGQPAQCAASGLSRLDWQFSDATKAQVLAAQKKFLQAAADVQFSTVEYRALTRDQIKRQKISPDSVMQLAVQLAYHQAHRGFAPTYESCSTAAFKKGRTECIRSATLATKEAVLELDRNGTKDLARLRELFKKASDVHSQLVKEGAMGQGFDRHLLGLRVTAERLGRAPPALFGSAVYQHMGQFEVSTSTLSTESIAFGGFGPVVRQGYGIGYNVGASRLGAVVSTFRGQRDSARFCGHVEESLDLIKKVLTE